MCAEEAMAGLSYISLRTTAQRLAFESSKPNSQPLNFQPSPSSIVQDSQSLRHMTLHTRVATLFIECGRHFHHALPGTFSTFLDSAAGFSPSSSDSNS